MKSISFENVMKLKRSLTGEVIPYESITSIIAEGCHQIFKGSDEATLGRKVLETVKRVRGPLKSTRKSTRSEQPMIRAVCDKLQKIIEGYHTTYDDMKERFGSSVMDEISEDIWRKYAKAPDVDSAKLAFNQIQRYCIAANRNLMNREVIDPIAGVGSASENTN
ncbi:hypothetical protein FQN54_002450 [Arachnomyces sp. PD_36]|nr:hypothetical protein FQN54_002450 [Arachnomyces sp. PD_36]